MSYRYEVLISEMDLFVSKQGDDSFLFSWQYIKSIIHAHCFCIHQATKEPLEDIKARVWSDWESLFSIESDDVIEPHLFVLKGLVDLYNYTAPSFSECNFWLEIAFIQARGSSKKSAFHAYDRYLERQGGYEKYYGEPDPRRRRKNKA